MTLLENKYFVLLTFSSSCVSENCYEFLGWKRSSKAEIKVRDVSTFHKTLWLFVFSLKCLSSIKSFVNFQQNPIKIYENDSSKKA